MIERDGRIVPIRPKTFALLSYLACNPDRVIAKDELLEAVWGQIVVTDDALTQTIRDVRRTIGSDAASAIRTLRKRGYLFSYHEDEQAGSIYGPGEPVDTPSTVLQYAKPSIAVLPFENMSGSTEQDYFADGTVDDIVTGLARIRWLSVIARNSSFAYKGRSMDVRQIGRELGVRYLLQGGVRKEADRVRITVQLVDARTGVHLWAERYDGRLDDIFDLQDRITEQVVATVEPNLQTSEIERSRRKRPESLDAYDLYLRALPYTASQMPDDARVAMPYLERALAIDPNYAAAHALLAWCHEWCFARDGFEETERLAALRHGRAAIVTGTDDATTLAIAAFVIAMMEKDYDTALSAIDRALVLNPSCATAMYLGAVTNAFSGRPAAAIALSQHALRLSPFDFLVYQAHLAQGTAAMQEARYADACQYYHKAVRANPGLSSLHFCAAAASAQTGDMDAARLVVEGGLELEPRFRLRMFSELMMPDVAKSLIEGGRKLSLPE